MMRIYVAGKNLERARSIIDQLRKMGHQITYDWVEKINDRSDLLKKAEDERKGVQGCDVLVYLWESDQESARYEVGMALGLNKPVILSGCEKRFFLGLPEVIAVKSDNEILHSLAKI